MLPRVSTLTVVEDLPIQIVLGGTIAFRGPNRDELLANYAQRAPAGPVLTPDDVAGAVYLLCLPEAAMINGHTLVVDGGFAVSG